MQARHARSSCSFNGNEVVLACRMPSTAVSRTTSFPRHNCDRCCAVSLGQHFWPRRMKEKLNSILQHSFGSEGSAATACPEPDEGEGYCGRRRGVGGGDFFPVLSLSKGLLLSLFSRQRKKRTITVQHRCFTQLAFLHPPPPSPAALFCRGPSHLTPPADGRHPRLSSESARRPHGQPLLRG